MLRRLGWLMLRELLESLRSQTALIVLLSPLLLAWLLQTMSGGKDLKPIPIVLCGPGDSGLFRVLEQHSGLAPRRAVDWSQALQAVAADKAVLAVRVDADFDRRLLQAQRPSLTLCANPGRPTQVALAREYLRAGLRQQAGQALPARIETERLPGARKSSSADFWLASAVVLASMSSMVIAAANAVDEKEAGILRQMLLSPATPNEVWLGKLAVSAALGTLSAMLVVALHGATSVSLWCAFGLTGAASFVFAALGGIIGLLAKGPAAASSWTGLCFIALFAPASLSETSQALSRWAHASPAYYLYDGVQRTVLAQEPIASQVTNFAALLACAAVLSLAGSRILVRYR